MDDTRVEKYKYYRSSLIRNGTNTSKNGTKPNSDSKLVDTLNTSTLPINEVYKNLEEKESQDNKLYELELKKTRIRYIFIGIGLFLVAAAIAVFAIFAFS